MKIRPNIPIFDDGGITPVLSSVSTVTQSDPNSNWYTRVGNHGILEETYNRLKALYDKYQQTKDEKDYAAYEQAVNQLNEDQKRYAVGYQYYRLGGNNLYTQPFVSEWQDIIKSKYPYVNTAIGNRWNQYSIQSPNPTSKDNASNGWVSDGYWAAITQDRTPWGYLTFGESDSDYQNWVKKFGDIGIKYYLDDDVAYGRLNRDYLNNPASTRADEPRIGPIQGLNQQEWEQQQQALFDANNQQLKDDLKSWKAPVKKHGKFGFDWNKLKEGAFKIIGNPNLWASARLAGNLINNERVYGEALKGIRPDLKQTYNTHRQVVGDEATKQAYYRKAAAGETKAGRAITSDMDRQLAYQMEAKRVGDELRAQGDLADNQEIRRTSDESNQHQWANIQRATEVANANIAAINQANALKHNLLAQKHSANWSSIDNFLQGIEYRKRQKLAEQQALDDKIFSLSQQQDLLYDPRIIQGQKDLEAVLDKHKKADGTTDYSNSEVKEAIRKWKGIQQEVYIESYQKKKQYLQNRGLINFDKSGAKITYKKKDDLLYKSAEDVVEHFRKMTKISSDAQNRKKPKIEKLTSHPKRNTRKYQQGGVAPFTVYKPIALGGETTTESSASITSTKASSSKKSGGDEALDMIKELFKQLSGKGLPSDTNSLYVSMRNLFDRAKAFGEDISTEDIASMYLQNMQQMNTISYYKDVHDKAVAKTISNNAENEFAIDAYGRLACQDKESGQIVFANSYNDAIEKGVDPLTNSQLSRLRSTYFAGREDLDAIIANGVGMSKIADFLKAQLPHLGSTEIEGYTKKDSNDIKAGLQLLKDAPDGVYTHYTKEQQKQAEMAIGYLKSILPTNMRAVLDNRAQMMGNLNSDALIAALVGSGYSSVEKYNAVTGRAAKSADGTTKSGGTSDNTAGLAFVLGQGPHIKAEFNTGTSLAIRVLAIKGTFQTHSGENLKQGSTLQEATKSQQGGYIHWNEATFGGSKLNPGAYSHIILNDSSVYAVDLPYKVDLRGNTVPNFEMLRKMEQADEIIATQKIDENNYAKINEIYNSVGLPDKYDANGNVIPTNYKRFVAIEATLDEKSLENKNSILSDQVALANDVERDLYIDIMKRQEGNKNYDLDNGWWIFGGAGKEQLYKGTIFAPYDEDVAYAAVSSGKAFDVNLPNNSSIVQQMQYTPATLSYKPAMTTAQIK